MLRRLLHFIAALTLILGCGVGIKYDSFLPPSVGGATSVPGANGSVVVTITGTNFVNGMSVRVDGVDCTDVHVLSSTELTCVLPNADIALVNIVLTTPGGGGSGGGGGGGGSSLSSPLVATSAETATLIAGPNTPWSNPDNGKTADSSSMSVNLSPHDDSNSVRLLGQFHDSSFTLPSSATITGLVVSCYGIGSFAGTNLSIVKLVIDGIPSGNSLAQTLPILGVGFTNDMGSSTDLSVWGVSLTPAQLNSANFGIELKANNFNLGPNSVSVNYCKISVYFN